MTPCAVNVMLKIAWNGAKNVKMKSAQFVSTR